MTTCGEGPGVGLGEGVGVGVGGGVGDGVAVGVGEGFGVGEGVGLGVGDGLGVGEGVGFGLGDGLGVGVGEGVGVGVGFGVGVGVGVGVGPTLSVASPSTPPARARSVVVPEASAVAVVRSPFEDERVAFFASLADHAKQTRGSSTSTPPVCTKARAPKSCRAPMSSEAEPGATSMRESGGEPKGVPSARVPGE